MSGLNSWEGALGLLVLQASPFCNIDCDYCYLPNRNQKSRMSFETVETIARRVFYAGLPAPELSVVWHAGEPLTVPRNWYATAFELIARHCPPQVHLTHHFQTNAVLIDQDWSEFIRAHDIKVGVSIDGPASLHDAHRRTRDGKGTHARVLEGIKRLSEAGIPFHAICVLTRDSLNYADEIFDFFLNVAPTSLCFNIEEVEATNVQSSLYTAEATEVEAAFRDFLTCIAKRLRNTPEVFRVREFDTVVNALRHPAFGKQHGNDQNLPGRILSVSWDGRFLTGSPELLGVTDPRFGEIVHGNIVADPIPPTSPIYCSHSDEIRSGVRLCRTTCKYFDFCLGGAPSNKLAEHGRFDLTETFFCRLTQQAVIDVVLTELDEILPRMDGTG